MNESVISFGERSGNVGILTETAAESQRRPCVILLNSGLVHRVGPNRVYVKIARELAACGFDVLRMDFSGVGDSQMRRDHLPYEKSATIEVRDAMDAMMSRRGQREFVLAGICSGAEAALQVALVDSRVKAIIPIEFYGYETPWYRLFSYRTRLLSPGSWFRLLSGRSELLAGSPRAEAPSANTETSSAAPPSAGVSPALPRQQRRTLVVQAIRELGVRHVQTCLMYAAGAAYFNFQTIFRWPLRREVASGRLSVVYLDSCDHTFTLTDSQRRLAVAVQSWLEAAFPVIDKVSTPAREEIA